MSESEYDERKKVEHTDVGFHVSIKHTRGTGTRDSDTVKVEHSQEEIMSADEIRSMTAYACETMTNLRTHQPDGDSE